MSYGNKIERPVEPKYSDAFQSTTSLTYKDSLICTNFIHGSSNDRKMQIKVGKITDMSILRKIKGQDSSGFADLLNFAKSSSAIYDKMLDADKSTDLKYTAYLDTSEKRINLTGVDNEAYYYLYVKTDDENGKYISNEAVTLAQASTYSDGSWFMFFYGSGDFKWADFGSTPDAGSTPTGGTDTTIAPTILPKAGFEKIIYVGIGLMIIGAGIISYKKYKKYQGI